MPITSQNYKDYFYSELEPKQTEKRFQKSESEYSKCVLKIKNRKHLDGRENLHLIANMFDFYLRSASHANATGREGYEAYKFRSGIFLQKCLLKREVGDDLPEEVISHIRANWAIKLFQVVSTGEFLTSDNPSFCIWRPGIQENEPDLEMIALPLTPTVIAVAYDRRLIRIISDQLTIDDERNLNEGQIVNAISCVYTATEPNELTLGVLREKFAQNEEFSNITTSNSIRIAASVPLESCHYSFLSRSKVF